MSNEKRQIKVTPLFDKTAESKKRFIVNIGGAGSSKTHSVLQHFIFNRLLHFTNYKLLVLRKYRHSNKLSIYNYFIELLKEYSLYSDAEHNKSDLVYQFFDFNNQVRFAGMDDREKIKSTEWHDILLEECNEFSREDFLFTQTRLYRGEVKFNTPRIYLTCNPVESWLRAYEGHKDFDFIWSNYKDNPFANKDAIETLEGLKEQDESYYNIYALGKWGVLKDLIYKPYKIITAQEYPKEFDDECFGLDFAYNTPTALLHIGYSGGARYLTEKLYRTKLTNEDLIAILKEIVPEALFENRSVPIYADSEDSNRIAEIYNAGFNVIPADKGKGSVKSGIDYCRRQTYYSMIENVNLNKEVSTYKNRQDKNGNLLDEPVKFNDHLLDGLRMAEFTHSRKQELRIL